MSDGTDDIEWARAVVNAHDARYVQARVTYTADDLGVHIYNRRTGEIVGVYQLDGPPTVKRKGKNGKPEIASMANGSVLTIVADCNCPRDTRRIEKVRH